MVKDKKILIVEKDEIARNKRKSLINVLGLDNEVKFFNDKEELLERLENNYEDVGVVLIDSYFENEPCYKAYSNLGKDNILDSVKKNKISGHFSRPVKASGFLREIKKAQYGSEWPKD